MKSPLIIMAELISGIITGIIDTMRFVIEKFIELMLSLLFYSSLGIYGFILAVFVGAATFILVTKFIFKSSRTLLSLGIALIAIITVLVFIWMM